MLDASDKGKTMDTSAFKLGRDLSNTRVKHVWHENRKTYHFMLFLVVETVCLSIYEVTSISDPALAGLVAFLTTMLNLILIGAA